MGVQTPDGRATRRKCPDLAGLRVLGGKLTLPRERLSSCGQTYFSADAKLPDGVVGSGRLAHSADAGTVPRRPVHAIARGHCHPPPDAISRSGRCAGS